MELNNQVFRAPSIPKIGKKTVSSSVIRGALKPQVKLRKSTFSFIKPVVKGVDTEKISGGASVSSNLAETNQILVEIQKQLALDFAYRIAEEKKALAVEKKRIAAQKVADKESKIEKGGKSLLGKTFDKVTAPIKSIFQKLIDFFSIILTGILLNTAFNWLSKEENRKKLKDFFNFLKEYWQELLIIFGAYKLARLVGKIYKIGKIFGKLFNIFKKKPPQLPCKCPKTSPTTDLCGKILDCIKNPASAFIKTLVKTLVAGGFILGAGSLKSLEGLLNGGLIPAAGAAPVTTPTKPTYEQIKANFDPRRDFSYYQKLGLSRGQWTKLQDEATSKPTGGYTAFATKPGQTFGMALNISSLLPFLGPGLRGTQLGFSAFRNPELIKTGLSRFGVRGYNLLQRFAGVSATRSAGFQSVRNLGFKSYKDLMMALRERGVQVTQNQLKKQLQQKEYVELYREALRQSPQSLKKSLDKSIRVTENISKTKDLGRKEFMEGIVRQPPGSPISTATKPDVTQRILKTIFGFNKGGTVFASNGMTVPGRGSGLVDSVKALLAPGEEVIRAAMARLYRPLLKDINDNGGKHWLLFSGATDTLLLNNKIQSGLNDQFKKLIIKFSEFVDDQIADEQRKKRKRNNRPPGNGGNTRLQSAINQKKSKSPKSQVLGGGFVSEPQKMQNFIINQTPVNVSNNILQPNLNINRSGIAVVPINVGNLQAQKQQPKVNIINLPPKTVNLAPKQGSVKTPSSGSATEVPSISPVDAGNPYISSLRLEYGMVM